MIHRYNVAVLYVGLPRSIRKTLQFLKKNILLTPNVHVFACLQNDGSNTDKWLEEELGDHLKECILFDINNPYESSVKNRLVQHPLFDSEATNYLKHMGTINSYMQMTEVYKRMWEYEQTHNITYDYVIRHRTDVIITKPIDFHWLSLTTEQINAKIEKIRNIYSDISDDDCISYLMNTIIHDDLIHSSINKQHLQAYLSETSEETLTDRVYKLIHSDNLALLLYYDFAYIINRKKYYLIPFAGTSYGYMTTTINRHHWWNSETQLIFMCRHAGLNVFNNGSPCGASENYEDFINIPWMLVIWCK